MSASAVEAPSGKTLAGFSTGLLTAFGIAVVSVVVLVVAAEWLGLLDQLSVFVPRPMWLAIVAVGGYPIFRSVLRATLRRKVTSHTLMTVGLVAAMLAGAWPAAVIIVFFMRLADYIVELLTGDNQRSAAAIAHPLGIRFRAGMLPEDKIAAVKEYQRQGRVVVMIGDGVNDAPALAQADVGIAMGAAGSAVAIDAAHIAIMREDWSLVPEAVRIARRTMKAVRFNIGFTAVYNLTALTLAAFGFPPPAIAAAAQAGPDFGILANSSRLLRQGKSRRHAVGSEAEMSRSNPEVVRA